MGRGNKCLDVTITTGEIKAYGEKGMAVNGNLIYMVINTDRKGIGGKLRVKGALTLMEKVQKYKLERMNMCLFSSIRE